MLTFNGTLCIRALLEMRDPDDESMLHYRRED
jgi:hypothetical protein